MGLTLPQLLQLASKFIASLRAVRTKNTTNPISPDLHQPQPHTPSPAYSWIGVSLNQESWNQLLTLAHQKNLTIEELIRHAITEFLHRPQP